MQRAVTPAIGILRTRAVANPLALLAAMYMLAASLPRKIGLMVAAITGRDSLDAGAAAGSATADAGDDAVEAELDGGEGGGAADGECDCEDEECAEEESTPVVRLGGDQVGEARATPSSLSPGVEGVEGLSRVCRGCVEGLSRVCRGSVEGLSRVWCRGCLAWGQP